MEDRYKCFKKPFEIEYFDDDPYTLQIKDANNHLESLVVNRRINKS